MEANLCNRIVLYVFVHAYMCILYMLRMWEVLVRQHFYFTLLADLVLFVYIFQGCVVYNVSKTDTVHDCIDCNIKLVILKLNLHQQSQR